MALDVVGYRPPRLDAALVDGLCAVDELAACEEVVLGPAPPVGTAIFVDGRFNFSGFVATDNGVVCGAGAVFLLVAANAVARAFMPGPVVGPVAAVTAAVVVANVDGLAAVDGASGLMKVRPRSANAPSMPWVAAAARFAASVDGSMLGNNPAGVGCP